MLIQLFLLIVFSIITNWSHLITNCNPPGNCKQKFKFQDPLGNFLKSEWGWGGKGNLTFIKNKLFPIPTKKHGQEGFKMQEVELLTFPVTFWERKLL